MGPMSCIVKNSESLGTGALLTLKWLNTQTCTQTHTHIKCDLSPDKWCGIFIVARSFHVTQVSADTIHYMFPCVDGFGLWVQRDDYSGLDKPEKRKTIRMSLNWKFVDLPSAVRRYSAEREWLISDQSTKAEKNKSKTSKLIVCFQVSSFERENTCLNSDTPEILHHHKTEHIHLLDKRSGQLQW